MLTLASIYFVNPHSSINPNGYKVGPALLKYKVESKDLNFGFSEFSLGKE